MEEGWMGEQGMVGVEDAKGKVGTVRQRFCQRRKDRLQAVDELAGVGLTRWYFWR